MELNNSNATFLEYYEHYSLRKCEIAVAILILFVSTVGTVSNVLIIVLFQKVHQLRNIPTRLLIQSLAIQDLVQIAIFHSIIVLLMLTGQEYKPSKLLCRLTYTVGYMVFPASYWCSWGINLARYCRCRGYNAYFRYRSKLVKFLSIWPWIVGFLLCIPGNLDVITVHYVKRLYACLWDVNDKFLLQLFIYCVSVHTPLITSAIFHISFTCIPTCIPITQEQKSIVRSVCIISVTSLVLQCPFVILMIFPKLSLPYAVYPWLVFIGLFKSYTNALVFMWQSKAFSTSLIMMFQRKSFEEMNIVLKPKYRLRFRYNRRLLNDRSRTS